MRAPIAGAHYLSPVEKMGQRQHPYSQQKRAIGAENHLPSYIFLSKSDIRQVRTGQFDGT